MLMHRRCFACSSWTWLTCPLLCIAKCAVFAVMSLTPVADSYGPFLRFPYCSTLTRWSSYCTCKAVGDSRAPLTCPLCSTTKPVVQRAENCSGPAVVARFSGGRGPCCAGRVGAAFCGYGRPLITQRQVYFLQQYRCLRFVHRQSPTETGIMGAMKGIFDAFCVIFRAPPVVPELSASFSSFRTLTPVSARGLQGCRSRREFHSQVTRHRVCANSSQWPVDKNIPTEVRVNNNNNNNNTIWGGSVLTGEEPPPHSGELKHALSQAGGPTQSQLSRPMSSGHHISMEHRLRKNS